MSLLEQFAAKAQVTGDVGEALDKRLDEAKAMIHRLQGAHAGVREAANRLKSVSEAVRKDFDEGKFEGLDAKAIHDLALDYLRKTAECLANFADLKKSEELAAQGMAKGVQDALEVVGNYHKTATARAAQLTAAIEEPVEDRKPPRATGEHPGPSTLDERRQLTVVPEETPAVTIESEKPRRSRKKKAAG